MRSVHSLTQSRPRSILYLSGSRLPWSKSVTAAWGQRRFATVLSGLWSESQFSHSSERHTCMEECRRERSTQINRHRDRKEEGMWCILGRMPYSVLGVTGFFFHHIVHQER